MIRQVGHERDDGGLRGCSWWAAPSGFHAAPSLSLARGTSVWVLGRGYFVWNGFQRGGLKRRLTVEETQLGRSRIKRELAAEPWIDAPPSRISLGENGLSGAHKRVELIGGVGELLEEGTYGREELGRGGAKAMPRRVLGETIQDMWRAKLIELRQEPINRVDISSQGRELVAQKLAVEQDALSGGVNVALNQDQLVGGGHQAPMQNQPPTDNG